MFYRSILLELPSSCMGCIQFFSSLCNQMALSNVKVVSKRVVCLLKLFLRRPAHLIDCLTRLKSARATASEQTIQIMVMTIIEIALNNTERRFAEL